MNLCIVGASDDKSQALFSHEISSIAVAAVAWRSYNVPKLPKNITVRGFDGPKKLAGACWVQQSY
ncbi:MAG: hypothetical protein HYX74_06920 [Acidobacteria bacterium]|nr:hypothetical protein [Acidobacteriota bacterium]